MANGMNIEDNLKTFRSKLYDSTAPMPLYNTETYEKFRNNIISQIRLECSLSSDTPFISEPIPTGFDSVLFFTHEDVYSSTTSMQTIPPHQNLPFLHKDVDTFTSAAYGSAYILGAIAVVYVAGHAKKKIEHAWASYVSRFL